MLHNASLSFEEKTNCLFELDQLLPMQFFDVYRRKTSLEPERLLMLAVLEDAVWCLQNHATCASGKPRKLFEEALQWILMDDDDWLFSFNNVCEAVGLSPGCLRSGLIRLTKTGAANAAKATSDKSSKSANGPCGRISSAWHETKGYANPWFPSRLIRRNTYGCANRARGKSWKSRVGGM